MSLNTRLDGNTGQEFPGAREPVENFGGESYGRVDLVEATRRSVNTAYFQLGLAVGPQEVAATAHAAGIPDDTPLANADGSIEGGISLGSYEVQVFDQAVGYATFANRGVPVAPYLVARVSRGDEVLYEAQVRTGERAFGEDVAADATYAMEQVLRRGTGRAARLDGGRDAAGKTGTSSDNRDAWFVGFTPQLSTAVWLGYATPRTIRLDGVEVTGGGSSSRIWKRFMDPALAGQPEVELPDPVYAGTRARLDREPSGTTPRRRRSAPAPAPVGPVAPETTAPAPTSAPPAPPPTTAPEAPQPEAPQPEAPQPEAPQPEAPQPEAPQPEAPQPAAPQPEAPPEPAAPAPSGAG
jgi:membrane peptidoglycan carboxypeptidase